MSISDRLDQISRQSVEADEQWDCGRSAFNADNYAFEMVMPLTRSRS